MLALIVLCACDGEEAGPTPELSRDIDELRRVINEDPAAAPIQEAERVADDRPVLAARMVRSGAIPAARQQLTHVRNATVGTAEGREYRARLRDAYQKRVDGLRSWHRYLEDAATDDELLLESSRVLREAHMEVMAIDRELEAVLPTAQPEAPEADEAGEAEPPDGEH